MITRVELAATFGEENLITMEPERARDIGLSEEDGRLLSRVGLPRNTFIEFLYQLGKRTSLMLDSLIDEPVGP